MSDNPLIKAFIKLHEGYQPLEEKIGPRPNQPVSTTSSAEGLAMGRGAVNNITMGAGIYGRAAVDSGVKNLGSLVGMSEPTTFDKELEQEKEKDTAAQRDYPAAYDMGDKLATVAQLATGVGAVKVLGKEALKAGLRSAVAKNASQTIAKNTDANDFNLGMRNALNLTPQMRVPPTPLKLTPNQMIPRSSKITPFPKNTKLTTEDQNESSKGNTEMSTNPFIKGFFDIEEARAKNTNIFDESKKLTAAQKKHLDKNDNDKIDAEDFKMLRKEEAVEEAKKNNAMVMARNISKALKAVNPDFLDIDRDGDKEESMKKAAADKKKENAIDEAVSDEHRERALATINARISKPGQPPKHPSYDDAPADIKTAVDNLAKMYKEEVEPLAELSDDALTKYGQYALSNQLKRQSDLMPGEKTSRQIENRKKGQERQLKKQGIWNPSTKEEVEFSEEEINFINSVMEAMPVAPTSENDSPNPTPKKKAEGSRAKGSMAD